MRFTTSKYISILFSIYTLLVVLFFGIAINVIFFRQRYSSEMSKITRAIQQDIYKQSRESIGAPLPRFADISAIRISYDEKFMNELINSSIFLNISKINTEYVMYVNRENYIIYVLPITRLIEAQINMIKLFLGLLLIFGGITYLFSKFLVKKSLKNLNQLVDFVKTMNIDNLDRKVPISGPKDDEINTIAYAIQNSADALSNQTKSLKSFVSYAGHELKTPLMSLNSAIDAGQRSGNYEKAFKKVKDGISRMDGLINTLVSTTLAEQKILERKKIDILPILKTNLQEQKENFLAKNIKIESIFTAKYVVYGDENAANIVFKNLIQNSFKYSPENTNIIMKLTKNKFCISNIGNIIGNEKNIFDRFWKGGENQAGYGIGLYLVKVMCEKMHWRIEAKQDGENVIFEITF